MAIAIKFDKKKAQALLDALENGEPIGRMESRSDILALGGACFFAVYAHGPAAAGEFDPSSMHREKIEAFESQHRADIHAALEYYARVMIELAQGDYDRFFEPVHRAMLQAVEGAPPALSHVEGLKRLPDRWNRPG